MSILTEYIDLFEDVLLTKQCINLIMISSFHSIEKNSNYFFLFSCPLGVFWNDQQCSKRGPKFSHLTLDNILWEHKFLAYFTTLCFNMYR